MKIALLIIDVQKAAHPSPKIVQKIEDLQEKYEHIFVSKFVNEGSFLPTFMNWAGYDDISLAFTPVPNAKVFEKNVYSSFIDDLKDFDEVHLCGYDTDACVYKTALDLIENGVRPVVLAHLCGSENDSYHQAGIALLKRNIGEQNVR